VQAESCRDAPLDLLGRNLIKSCMLVEALILDMDGVLTDTEPLHIRAWEEAMKELSPASVEGADALGAFHAEREKMAGMTSVDIARALIATYRLSLSPERLLSRKRDIYRSMIAGSLELFPGLAAELDQWKGTHLALATSSTRVETTFAMQQLGIAGLFEAIVTSDDVARAKPAPDCYLLAARLLGKAPAQCWVVEDSAHGIRAALDAGARVLAVAGSPDSRPEAAPASVAGRFASTVEALQWLRK
jgi:beta-phosphoglucomutase